MNTMTMAAAVSQVYHSSPGLMDQDIGWQPATLTVMKQEPMDAEHLTRSPINDSGISPDHGSSAGSSAGRPSPGQQAGCDPRSSPDNRQQGSPNRTPVCGVNQLSPHGMPPKTSSPASVVSGNTLSMSMSTPVGYNRIPDHQEQGSPGRKPIWSVSQLSPQGAPQKTTSPSTVNPLAIQSGLNVDLSDDNSRSSSSMDGDSLYSKSGLDQSPLRCLQMTVEKTTLSAQQKSDGSGGVGGPRHPFQCPLCEYNTLSRTEFNDHLRAHYPDFKCDKCEFTTRHEDELLAHTREQHMSSPMEGGEVGEDGNGDANSPQVTAQGKVKQYRCKQCSFVAVIKVEYWLHLRTHMRPDKILNCPRCLFATELKHHLEYHLRNHEQRKPYRCTECNYRCVNKSMLNSHLKSHSSVYQYRCASCSYATKYCHSLKLHLRKYDHTPDMVLNPDGTPNPHPIIDVYGTRRGPKQRPKLQATKQETPVTTSAPVITTPQVSGIQLGMLQAPYGLLTPHRDMPLPYPFASLMSNAFAMNNNNSIMMEYNQNAQEKQNITIPSENVFNNMLPAALLNNNIISKQNPAADRNEQEVQFSQEIQTSVPENSNDLETPAEKNLTGTPLDLSKPEPMFVSPEPTTTTPISQNSQVPAAKCITKNRRKGQAFKLDNISRKLQQQCVSEQESVIKYQTDDKPKCFPQPEEQETTEVKRNCEDNTKQVALQGVPEKTPNSVQSNPEVFHCSYCAITFGDPIMYTIHKGYHGFQDPFTCNMCGIQTSNRVEFFLHVARHPHC